MSTIGSGVGLIALLLAATLLRGPALQRDHGSFPELNPYPGSVEFCREHIVGAPTEGRKAGPHVSWTGYYSTDPLKQVVSHYTKLLGSKNHRKEDNGDVWRFPLDEPRRVLTVTLPQGTFPLGRCCPPPKSARAIVIISMMTRPD